MPSGALFVKVYLRSVLNKLRKGSQRTLLICCSFANVGMRRGLSLGYLGDGSDQFRFRRMEMDALGGLL
jgi:hypothetical protein